MGRWLGIIGIAGTAAYVTFIGWLMRGRWDKVLGMDPNNVGDFLGGTFGPLAAFWLILGFFQQGIELRQNAHQLEMQAKELAESARQQRELVAATRDQLALERDALQQERERHRRLKLPIFVVRESRDRPAGHTPRITHNITNIGATCMNPRIGAKPAGLVQLGIPDEREWERGAYGYVQYFLDAEGNHPEAEIAIHYLDAEGQQGAARFDLVGGALIPVPHHLTPEAMRESTA